MVWRACAYIVVFYLALLSIIVANNGLDQLKIVGRQNFWNDPPLSIALNLHGSPLLLVVHLVLLLIALIAFYLKSILRTSKSLLLLYGIPTLLLVMAGQLAYGYLVHIGHIPQLSPMQSGLVFRLFLALPAIAAIVGAFKASPICSQLDPVPGAFPLTSDPYSPSSDKRTDGDNPFLPSRRARRIELSVVALVFTIGLLVAINHYRMINRENDNRALCRANLSKIYRAIINYENDFKNRKPKSLELLVELGRLTSSDLKCPSVRTGNGSDYTYCLILPTRDPNYWRRMSSEPAEAVVMYDLATNHGDGINMIFRDGSSEFLEIGANAFANVVMREVEAGYYPIDSNQLWRAASTQPSK